MSFALIQNAESQTLQERLANYLKSITTSAPSPTKVPSTSTLSPAQQNLAKLRALLDAYGITVPPRTTPPPPSATTTLSPAPKPLREQLDAILAMLMQVTKSPITTTKSDSTTTPSGQTSDGQITTVSFAE